MCFDFVLFIKANMATGRMATEGNMVRKVTLASDTEVKPCGVCV